MIQFGWTDRHKWEITDMQRQVFLVSEIEHSILARWMSPGILVFPEIQVDYIGQMVIPQLSLGVLNDLPLQRFHNVNDLWFWVHAGVHCNWCQGFWRSLSAVNCILSVLPPLLMLYSFHYFEVEKLCAGTSICQMHSFAWDIPKWAN